MRAKEAKIIQEALDMIGSILRKKEDRQKPLMAVRSLEPEKGSDDDTSYLDPLLDSKSSKKEEGPGLLSAEPAGPVRIVIRGSNAAQPR